MVLKGVSPLISPDLLRGLAMMGHGDEIVLADAFFPAHSIGKEGPMIIRADGLLITDLLEAVLSLIELDQYVHSPVTLMEVTEQDQRKGLVVKAWDAYVAVVEENNSSGKPVPFSYLERFKFYERAKQAFIIVQTGDTAQYGNIILKNGIVSSELSGKVSGISGKTDPTLYKTPSGDGQAASFKTPISERDASIFKTPKS